MEGAEAFCYPFAKARLRLFWGMAAIDPRQPFEDGSKRPEAVIRSVELSSAATPLTVSTPAQFDSFANRPLKVKRSDTRCRTHLAI